MSIHEGNSFVGHLLQVRGLDLAVRVGRGDVSDSEVVREDEDGVGKLVAVGVKKTTQNEQREERANNHGRWGNLGEADDFLPSISPKGKESFVFELFRKPSGLSSSAHQDVTAGKVQT